MARKPTLPDVIARADMLRAKEKDDRENAEIAREVAKEMDVPAVYLGKATAQIAEETRKRRLGRRLLFGISAAVLALLLLWSVASVNSFSRSRGNLRAARAQLSSAIGRKSALVPKLAELLALDKAEVSGLGARVGALETLGGGSSTLPDTRKLDEVIAGLKAELRRRASGDTALLKFMDELAGSENRIAVEGMRYNEAAQANNSLVATFPNSLLAFLFGFGEAEYFKAGP